MVFLWQKVPEKACILAMDILTKHMLRTTILVVLLLMPFSRALHAQMTTPEIPGLALIPAPKHIAYQTGHYSFPASTPVAAFEKFAEIAQLLREHPFIRFGKVELIKKKKHIPEHGIRLVAAEEQDALGDNAFRIRVDSGGITLTAHRPEAMINAIMTLVQIAYLQKDGSKIPYLDMEDAPRFGYRGLHLDVSRHFFPVSFIKKYLDLMAIYKLNTFHWHLTDGAGWRLQINKYPELTQKAAWRNFARWKSWWNSGRRYATMGDPNASGGFYTQEEVRDLVRYAAMRGITIIPEIEMPGHSEEVLAVYPHLSCSGNAYENSDFCVGNEQTFTFLSDVLSEVVELFPSPMIHIGGDEASKKSWASCPKCQQRMKDEGLKDLDELQSYAVRRMADFLKSKGRKLIGWDEILEGGLPPEAIVMSWRGHSGGVQAANAGHDVILTPGNPMYFDAYQSNPLNEPEAIGGLVPLAAVYAYEPPAAEIKPDKIAHILGIQANVWTEYMPTTEHVEYMVFPRALALSEVAWSAQDNRNWDSFQNRLQSHYLLLQRLHVNYYRPSFKPYTKADFLLESGSAKISISSEQYQPMIRYTIDGSEPSAASPRYTEPLELFKSSLVKSATFADSVRLGEIDSLQVDIHKGIGKKVVYNNPWDSYAARGDSTLVNGVKGSLDYGDGEWQGFTKGGLDVTLDFERREEIKTVSLRFMQNAGPGVFMPGTVSLEISDNGKDFREVQKVKNDIPASQTNLTFRNFNFNLNGRMARYIRVKADNPQGGYLFTDEIVVY